LAFLALSLPGLASPHPHWQRRAWLLTGLIVIAGAVLGGVQTLRGAHYPSHTAWTALLCAAAAWATHGLFAAIVRNRHRKTSSPRQAEAAT
jgi:membrane-associated PAP2 superfamily phosphatase